MGSQAVENEPVGVIGRLMQELGKLPGIGPKSAERLAHHLLAAARPEVIDSRRRFASDQGADPPVQGVLQPDGERLCSICADPRRDRRALRRGTAARRDGAGALGEISGGVTMCCTAGWRRSTGWGRTVDDRPTAGSRAGRRRAGSHHGDQPHHGGRRDGAVSVDLLDRWA